MPLPDTTDVAPRPFRDGLLQLDPPALLGSRCSDCSTVVFPPRDFCPMCRAVDGLSQVALSDRGLVYSFTIVRQAPAGIETPYVLAQIDLPADGVRVMATVIGVRAEDVRLDMPVRLELSPFGVAADGADLVGYRFSAAALAGKPKPEDLT